MSQPAAPRFRIADEASIETLLVLIREFHAYASISTAPDVTRRALGELLAAPALGTVWLVEDGPVAIGYAVLAYGFSLELGGRDAILDELYVREAYRARGVGRAALAVVEKECRARGVRALHVEVDESDARAQGFYAGAGFRSRLADAHNFLMTKRV